MQWSFDRVVGIAGLVLSIPGFVLLFAGSQRGIAIGVLGGAVFLLVTSLFLYRLSELPDFTGIAHETTITLASNGDAMIRQKYLMRANYAHTTALTLSNLAADGEAPTFHWNGSPIPAAWLKKRFGDYVIHVPLAHPVTRWKTLEGVLEWTARGAVTSAHESITIAPDRPVRSAIVRVVFPADRTWKGRPGATRLSPSGRVRMADPIIEDDGKTVRLAVHRVRPGDEFEIFWDW